MDKLKTIFLLKLESYEPVMEMFLCKRIYHNKEYTAFIDIDNNMYVMPVDKKFHTNIMHSLFNSDSVWINAVGFKVIDDSQCKTSYEKNVVNDQNEKNLRLAMEANKKISLSIVN